MAVAPFHVLRFWTTYPVRGGQTVEVDMVEYCGIGRAQSATTIAPVSHLSRVRQDGDPDNPAFRMARDRWAVIGPLYAAWKAGQEVPANGTPLAAWAGVTAEQAEVLRSAGLRTVEDVAAATDSIIGRVPLPGLRGLQDQAKAFLDSRGAADIAAQMAQKDAEMAAMRAEMEELKRLMLEAEPDLEPDGAERPRRRGRPPRTEVVAA